jgi:hypothetical protein
MKDQFDKLLNEKEDYTPVEYGRQCHKVGNKLWYVSSLVEYAKSMEVQSIKIEDIRAVKLNLPLLKDHGVTHLEIAYHMRVAMNANMDYPIILAKDGRIMDGHHRVIKALAMGIPEVKVVQFGIDPEPDKYIDSSIATESLQPYFYNDMFIEYV